MIVERPALSPDANARPARRAKYSHIFPAFGETHETKMGRHEIVRQLNLGARRA
jgi:hypothetical protein